MAATSPIDETDAQRAWYSGISRYQWTVLAIASAGWIFDTFEGQIFVASMKEAIPSLVSAGTDAGRIAFYDNIALAAFLLGGAIGGIGFGVLSDRIGRTRTLSLTILFYSLFTGLSVFSQEWWHLAGLRFLVALGTGGEWAVASALVAEVFPRRSRAHVGSLFHASSTLGTYMAIAAGTFLIGNAAIHDWARGPSMAWVGEFFDPTSLPWRLGFAIGVLPALLTIWIRMSLREPESWEAARAQAATSTERGMGKLSDLMSGVLLRRTLVGLSLATIGLATFWGTYIYGKNALLDAVENGVLTQAGLSPETLSADERADQLEPHQHTLKRWEMLGMFLVTTGGGVGLVAFGPLAERLGRRGAFLFFQLGGLVSALLLFQVVKNTNILIGLLPIFGFLNLGMHAGFAVYFPELYPTRLRGTGAGLCFNGARILAAPILFLNGWLRDSLGITLFESATMFSLLYVVGIGVLVFAPETRGKELPE